MLRTLAILTCLLAVGPAFAQSDFEQKVLPILTKHCLACHSHAAGKMRGGLTLDSKSGWQQGGDTGPAITPGEPDKSLLIQAVRYTNPELRMPPKAKLPDADIAVLVDWVKSGAPDPRTVSPIAGKAWAFQPIAKPPVPRGTHPIDAFLEVKYRETSLKPQPAADRATLIRRLTFDLHGLPPTPEDVAAFLNDSSLDAYERLVDRLLASPRYGERMGRLWLDVVHYGESNGFGMDRPRMNAWPYRDYVIKSFNDDVPYARFVREQIAGDVLGDGPESVPALGFIATGPFNQSALAEQVPGTLCHTIAKNLDRDDMVSNVATTFLSVTLHCARCHEHKFDPISMRDYYRMQSIFAGVIRGNREYDNDPAAAKERQRWVEIRKRLSAGDALDAKDQDELAPMMAAAEKTVLDAEARWQVLTGTLKGSSGDAEAMDDGSWRWKSPAAEKDTYTFVGDTIVQPIAAIRVEVLTDDSLPHKGPGRQPTNGNLHLSEIKVSASLPEKPEKVHALKIKKAFADFNQEGWDVAKAIDGNPATAWGVHPREGRSHQAVFVFEQPIPSHPGATRLTVQLEQLHGMHHVIGRLRLSVLAADPSGIPLVSPDAVAALKKPMAERPADAKKAIYESLGTSIVERKLASLPPSRMVFAIGKDIPAFRNYRPPAAPDAIHILKRGDVSKPQAAVTPGALEAVVGLPHDFALENPKDERQRRAALAKWVSDPANPLTWRSIVNRVWGWHFERGLVETPNDFGRMGGTPSHPELLDWLAADFRDSGGSIKRLHRLIVTSAAYRQASGGDALVDGDNVYLARMKRRRLDAEQLRDALLSVTGKIDLTMGGPSVMQFAYSDPNPDVFPSVDYDKFDPDSPASFRRAVYRFIFRNVNEPLLDAFDSANPMISAPRRDSTITALQALSLYNNKFVLRQCEHLAERLKRESDSGAGQVQRAFLLLYGRRPNSDEAMLVERYAERHGLAHACRVLVNANEFLFVP